jgi:mxaJ protein
MKKTSNIQIAAVVFLASSAQVMAANDQQATPVSSDPSILRVCSASNEAPYSRSDGSGFENRIADVLAKAMGRKVQFVWYNKPAIYLVKDQLNPGACDIVMGVDDGDDRVLTSRPYYRAPYVFIERKDSKLDIASFDSPDLGKTGHIAFEPNGPAQVMLQKLDLYNRNFNYLASLTDFKSKRNQYVRLDPARIVGEVESGKADVGVAFAPEVARYVKDKSDDLKMVVVPDDNVRSDGQRVPFAFDQSIAVRKDDQGLLDKINAALEKARPQITGILKDEGIPLLTMGEPEQKTTPSKS